MIKTISVHTVADTVCNLFLQANTLLPDDIYHRLSVCAQTERCALAKSVLQQTLQNADLARQDTMPICQDTGMAFVFLRIGQDIHFTDGSLTDAVNEGVRRAYGEGCFRKSVADPLTRVNTGDNTPAILYTELIPGDQLEITALPKGFGSENMSRIRMMNPTSSEDDIAAFVTETVREAGGNPCPPTVIGVGIGGSFDYAAFLAKKALARPIGQTDGPYAALEQKILSALNDTQVGPQGFGGDTTSLWVNIESYPTHIASLPVAVNISCHATRHASATL